MRCLLAENEKVFESNEGIFVAKEALKNLVLCLAPYAPHFCEELWRVMGEKTIISKEAWPGFRADLLTESTFTLVVQVNGKVRDKIELKKGISKDDIQKQVMQLPKVQQFMEGKPVKQFVYVPERLANVVVG
jgi:leucyl-tRNA synthetase